MDKRNYWFKFNAESWLSSSFISEISLEAVGAYINLLAASWMDDNCSLPTDETLLQKKMGLTDRASFDRVWPQLSPKFKRRNGRLFNEVLFAEFIDSANRRSKAVNAGKKNGERFRTKQGTKTELKAQPQANSTTATTTDTDTNTSTKNSCSKRQKPKKTKSTRSRGSLEMDYDFNKFWSKYPRRVGRKNAEKAWLISATSPEAVAAILEGLGRAVKCRQWLSDGGQFIPHASTWLRREGWNDEYDGRNIAETERMPGLPF